MVAVKSKSVTKSKKATKTKAKPKASPAAAVEGMTVEWWDIDRPIPYDRNPRVLTQGAIAGVAHSIKKYGWRQPIVVDGDDVVVVGHTRLEAAKLLGIKRVPVHVATELTDQEIRAYRISDNKVAEGTSWDKDLLSDEMAELLEQDIEIADFGFSDADFAKLIDELTGDGEGVDVQAEWEGMPEFDQKDKRAFRSIVMHFHDQDGVDEFLKAIGKQVTDKTRFLWYPEIEIERYMDKRYASDKS